MGWDYVEYRGIYEQFNEFDLWTLRHFFVEEALQMESDQPSEDTAKLREFFEAWDWYGTGVFVGTNFSDFVGDSRTRWELLLQLLHRAGDRIAGFGESIPVDYLNTHLANRGGYFTGAQPVGRYWLCIGRISSLISTHQP
jgi:hypothetical protein